VTSFSQGETGAVTPKQFRSGPGQIGVDAARRGLRPPRAGVSSRSAGSRGAASSGGLGLPESQPQEMDASHLVVGLQHYAATSLGRDIPLGIWMMRTGAHGEHGVPLFDYLYGDHGG
jgi:hypothetical protein